MPYAFLEHIADVRIRVSGGTQEELFRDALLGMVDVMNPSGKTAKIVTRTISLDSTDLTALLIDFLNEALVYMHTAREAYADVSFKTLTGQKLEAELTGYVADTFDEDIKAVTYHEADVKENANGKWETNLVFDV